MTISGKTFGCDKKHGAHGSVGPQDAIARSCNIAAANWALRIGREDFLQYIKDMGLLEKPGLGLPQEARGLFDDTETAQKLQLALLGFGQPINCTPIALASAFSTLANNGLRMKPRLVKQIGTKEIKSQVAGQIIKSETAQELLTCMEAVVESDRGTGKTLRIPGYRIGGKTGTAQKRNAATGSMKGGGYVSNFVGFVPADKPRAVILVMINNPDKRIAYYGAAVAGPAFQDIAKAVIHKLQIPKSQ